MKSRLFIVMMRSHLSYIFLIKSIGVEGSTFGGSRFWVWGRREDRTVLYLIVGSLISLVLFLPYCAFS